MFLISRRVRVDTGIFIEESLTVIAGTGGYHKIIYGLYCAYGLM